MLLARAYRARGWRDEDLQLWRRLRFAQIAHDPDALLSRAAEGKRALDEIELHEGLDGPTARELERHAPDTLLVPSGRTTDDRFHLRRCSVPRRSPVVGRRSPVHLSRIPHLVNHYLAGAGAL